MPDQNKEYLHHVIDCFSIHANPDHAAPMESYMKHKVKFFGIKTPERKALTRSIIQDHGRPDASEISELTRMLWDQPQRELHYFGLDILETAVKKKLINDTELFRFLVTTKSWWDTVDWLAIRIVGTHLKHHPDDINNLHQNWMDSGHLWLQRVCILFQLKYKKYTDVSLLYQTVTALSHSNEFFIQKAIGWALREYSKTDAQKVLNFVNTHPLKPLSLCEALKVINRKKV